MHKRILSILLLLIFIVTLSGCSLFSPKTTAKKKIPTDTEVLEEVTKGKVDSTVTKQSEDELELKHLKNAVPLEERKPKTAVTPATDNNQGTEDTAVPSTIEQAPVSAPVPYRPDYNIHFLSEDEAKMIGDKLIKLGYLKESAKDNKEFTDAIYRFQQDEKISGSGEINPETFQRLRSK